MKVAFIWLLVMTGLQAQAQTLVQNFMLTNVVNEHPVSLESYSGFDGVVIIFTSANCPYDNYYNERLIHLVIVYQGKVQFLLINSHLALEDTSDKMKLSYDLRGIPVPYLSDKEQVAMETLGARRSPEAYVLKNINGKYYVYYSGAIDDNPIDPSSVTVSYLKTAIDDLLAGKEPGQAKTRVSGCSIQKK